MVPGAPTGPGGLPNAAYVARTAHYHIIIIIIVGSYGESNSEIEFSESDDETPEGRMAGGAWRKPVPPKLVIKAARARRARRNNTTTADSIQNSAVK